MRLLLLALVLAACSTPPPSDLEDAPPPSTDPAPADPEGREAGATDGPFADLEDYRTQRAEAVAALDEAVGTPAASGARSCLVLPVGEKPCGGPSSFVVYSTETAEVPVLLGLAERVAGLDREATAQFGLASDCMVLSAPRAALEDGRCVLEGE